MRVEASASHLVLMPSYNTGPRLLDTVRGALAHWSPVWVILDGCTDGSAAALAREFAGHPALRVLPLPANRGKGAAVLAGLHAARAAGFQSALVMDADGQHPADHIVRFMEISARHPKAMILGEPIFGPEAPAARVQGRRVGNWWTNLETLWGGIHDSLFGFRIYPIAESVEILDRIRGGRRYDFDTQLAVRLYWRGVRPINVPVPVRYFARGEGGVSHFHYVRDNWLLIRAHAGLLPGMIARLPRLLRLRRQA
jgi:glycosyltransferase involved in cell wall biosynthesis